ncbi:MAG: hypothetical protein LBE82_03445, partial [Chitinophagaceae bacterium]|nr:hypothetical protein [Chitinophagaceae bacterium]
MSNSSKYYTQADIERYLNGSMPAWEMHEMERAALANAMLADAMEGYYEANKEETQKHLTEINNSLLHVAEKAKIVTMPSAKTKWWRGLAVAATIAGLMLTSWFLLFHKKEQSQNTAQNITTEKPADTLKKQETEKPPTTLDTAKKDIQIVDKKSVSASTQPVQPRKKSEEKIEAEKEALLKPPPPIVAASPKKDVDELQDSNKQGVPGAVASVKTKVTVPEMPVLPDSQAVVHNNVISELQGRAAGVSVTNGYFAERKDTVRLQKNAMDT